MSLTPEELELQIESLNATIATLTDAGKAESQKVADLTAKLAEAVEAAKKSPAADYEDVKAKLATITAEIEPVKKQNLQLQEQVFTSNLRVKYPDVDLSLIPADMAPEM